MIFLSLLLASVPVADSTDMAHRHISDTYADVYCLNMHSIYGLPCEVVERYYDTNGNKYYDFAVYIIVVNGDRRVLTYAYRSGKWFFERLSIHKDNFEKPSSFRIDNLWR